MVAPFTSCCPPIMFHAPKRGSSCRPVNQVGYCVRFATLRSTAANLHIDQCSNLKVWNLLLYTRSSFSKASSANGVPEPGSEENRKEIP